LNGRAGSGGRHARRAARNALATTMLNAGLRCDREQAVRAYVRGLQNETGKLYGSFWIGSKRA